TRTYFSVTKQIWGGQELSTFSRKQLEIYRELPSSMFGVIPILVFLNIPILDVAVFPLVYFFPRQFLSYHFWSTEQKKDFALHYHSQRVAQHKPIIKGLAAKVKKIKDTDSREKLEKILQRIKAKSHPSVDEILAASHLFQEKPLELSHISRPYMRHLAKGMLLHSLLRQKLLQDAVLINYIDRAMQREGIDKLTEEELRSACFTRGLNATRLSKDDMIHYLTQWTTISMEIDETNISLLLHKPVLLAYNHPDNKSIRKALQTS
ncbi:unnamed protein product, partial [Owenia fusiformis]